MCVYDITSKNFYHVEGKIFIMKVIEPKSSHLSATINRKKKEMVTLGLKYGLTDWRTVKCSQQLDTLLNLQNNLKPVFITGFIIISFIS